MILLIHAGTYLMDNKFASITILYNQESNLDRVLPAYDAQTKQPDTYVFVLDRCSDNSISKVIEFSLSHNCLILEISNGEGFNAGSSRSSGLELVRNNHSVFLFLDGDCIPTSELFMINYTNLTCSSPAISINKRVFESKNSTDNDTGDHRTLIPWVKTKVFKSGLNNKVVDTYVSRWRSLVVSCCFGINTPALAKVQEINLELFSSTRMFPEVFDGLWGGEDDYIGWIAMLFCIDVVAIDPINHVRHIWHESRQNTLYKDTSDKTYDKLVSYAKSVNAPGVYQADIDLQRIAYETVRRS